MSAPVPIIALPVDGMPGWLRVLVGAVVVVAVLVGIAAMVMAMRRSRELQDGAPPLPHRPWTHGQDAQLPGPPSPVAPDDVPLEQRLAAIDEAHASGRIDAAERERARRDLLGDDPDELR